MTTTSTATPAMMGQGLLLRFAGAWFHAVGPAANCCGDCCGGGGGGAGPFGPGGGGELVVAIVVAGRSVGRPSCRRGPGSTAGRVGRPRVPGRCRGPRAGGFA